MGTDSTLLRVGSFLPPRPRVANLTLDPAAGIGCLRPGLQEAIMAGLDALPGIAWHHGLNFRRAVIRNGDVWCDGVNLSGLDAFVWYCEVDRAADSFDFDVLRTLARTTRVVRSPEAFLTAVDKFSAHVRLRDAGVPVPDSVLFDHRAPAAMSAILEEWGAAVLKPRLGGWGKGVTLIEDADQLRDVVDYMTAVGGRRSHFLERYHDNDLAQWVSVLVIGGEIAYGYRKLPSKHVAFGGGRRKILDADERGGEVELAVLSDAHRAIALRSADALGCSMIGFDMLWTDDGPVVIDENTSPGHYAELFEEAGVSAADLWVRWLDHAVR